MKKHRVVLLCAVLAALTGACGKSNSGESALIPQDLLHHRFVLVSSDGKDFSANKRIPSIEFNEGLRISGTACNQFTGQGHLAGNILTVKQLASTKMLCVDPDLNELENLLQRVLSEGAQLRLNGQNLVIRQNGHELLYKRNDWVR
ncbi:MAG: META domain-containing protein [Desulfobulbus sp.]|nr:META domain-containing protein [Desulfobulbus sp.]